jgi:hypothetical protein
LPTVYTIRGNREKGKKGKEKEKENSCPNNTREC